LPNTLFRIIGDGPERANLESLAKELDVADRVDFVGARYDLAEQLAHADCYVMPSYSEGYGLALLEAIGMGMPVVCSDLPIYNDLLPVESVPRFAPDNCEQLAAAVSNVLDATSEFSFRTRQVYDKFHRSEQMAENFYNFITAPKL
jgi:glycosyltransferase involved in cell wall biosynthesis